MRSALIYILLSSKRELTPLTAIPPPYCLPLIKIDGVFPCPCFYHSLGLSWHSFPLVKSLEVAVPIKKYPPGKLGLPVIGETLQFLSALRAGTPQLFFDERVEKFGDVFKTSLIGHPTVVLYGAEGNRLVLSNEDKLVQMSWPNSFLKLLMGGESIANKRKHEHLRLRGALARCLGPQALKKYIPKMSLEIERHIAEKWKGESQVKMLALVKDLVFSLSARLFFGITDDDEKKRLHDLLDILIAGSLSLPLDFPGTRYRRALHARSIVDRIFSSLIEKRRIDLHSGTVDSSQDFLSVLIGFRDEQGNPLTDREIIDNFNGLFLASYDTTVSALTLMFKLLSSNPDCYEQVVKEQMTVMRNKSDEEEISWKDVSEMKYTWQAAQETLRMTPPHFGTFREAIVDIDYKGYTIPKGWKILWTIHSTHRKEEHFSEPDKFKPSRFEEGSSDVAPYTFLPFAAGLRVCPGWEFAKVEMLLFVHHFVKSFSGFTAIDPAEKVIADPFFSLPANGFHVKLLPRT